MRTGKFERSTFKISLFYEMWVFNNENSASTENCAVHEMRKANSSVAQSLLCRLPLLLPEG